MITFAASSSFDMGRLSLAMFGSLKIVNSESHYFSFTSSATEQDYFSSYGKNLKYKSGAPSSGTLTDLYGYDLVKWGDPYVQRFSVSGFEIKVGDVLKVGRTKSTADDLAMIKAIFSGKDTFFGSSGKDVLYGYDGEDWFSGGKGDDTFFGGDGDDAFNFEPGKDRYVGGDGSDVVDYRESKKATKIDLSNWKNNSGDAKGDVFESIERARGGDGYDTLVGNKQSNWLEGSHGKDTLWGAGGKDYFVFGDEVSKKDIDTIRDFSVKDDTIFLSRVAFFGLPGTDTTPPGERLTLPERGFLANTTGKASGTGSFIVYNTKTGAIALDSDGTDAQGGDIFAYVAPNLKLSAADFLLSG